MAKQPVTKPTPLPALGAGSEELTVTGVDTSHGAIATTPQNGALIAQTEEDDHLASMAGEGNEMVGVNDVVVPLIRVLQDTSKVVKRTDPAYIPGIVAGSFFNTLTRRAYGDAFPNAEMFLVDAFFKPIMSEWVPNQGGLVGFYELTDDRVRTIKTTEVDGRRRDYFPDTNNDAVSINQHYVLALDPTTGTWEPAILPLSSTQLKKSRQLNAFLGQQKLIVNGQPRLDARGTPLILPRFATVVKATLRPESNDAGSWFGIEFSLEGRAPRHVIDQAKAFKDLVHGGTVKANLNDLDEGRSGGQGGAAPTGVGPSNSTVGPDDEIPF